MAIDTLFEGREFDNNERGEERIGEISRDVDYAFEELDPKKTPELIHPVILFLTSLQSFIFCAV